MHIDCISIAGYFKFVVHFIRNSFIYTYIICFGAINFQEKKNNKGFVNIDIER